MGLLGVVASTLVLLAPLRDPGVRVSILDLESGVSHPISTPVAAGATVQVAFTFAPGTDAVGLRSHDPEIVEVLEIENRESFDFAPWLPGNGTETFHQSIRAGIPGSADLDLLDAVETVHSFQVRVVQVSRIDWRLRGDGERTKEGSLRLREGERVTLKPVCYGPDGEWLAGGAGAIELHFGNGEIVRRPARGHMWPATARPRPGEIQAIRPGETSIELRTRGADPLVLSIPVTVVPHTP